MGRALTLHIFLVLWFKSSLAAPSASAEAQACSSKDIAAALNATDVTTIILTTDVVLAAADFAHAITIDRNLTITSRNIAVTSEPWPWPVLDLAYLRSKLLVTPGVVVIFTRLFLYRHNFVPVYTMFNTPGAVGVPGLRVSPRD